MAKLPEIKISIDYEKMAKGIVIADLFDQSRAGGLLRFSEDKQTILINERVLMHAIQIMAPMQNERKLKLVTQDEWINGDW